MKRYNHFLYGFIPGIILPIIFLWIYLGVFYSGNQDVIDKIKFLYHIYPFILGKLCLLSVIPDLIMVFVFYKTDSFKIAAGVLLGGMPYLIASIFML